MEISVPKPEKHHELAGGSVIWTNTDGRIRVRKIHMVFHDGNPNTVVLIVRAHGEPQPSADTVFTLKRKTFE